VRFGDANPGSGRWGGSFPATLAEILRSAATEGEDQWLSKTGSSEQSLDGLSRAVGQSDSVQKVGTEAEEALWAG